MAVRDSLPVLIGARRYNVDLAGLARATIDPIRQGFDTQGTPGEQSLNQAGVWKRSRNNWDLGAGQREADTDEANNRRFYTSQGVDVWTKNELSLLKTTVEESSGGYQENTPSNCFMTTSTIPATHDIASSQAGDWVYVTADTRLYFSNDNGDTWAVNNNITNTTGSGGLVTGLASDGRSVYICGETTDRVQVQYGGVTPYSVANTDYWVINDTDGNGPDGIWCANGYVLVSIRARLTVLYDGSAPSTDYDITSESFQHVEKWRAIVGSPGGIYAGGTRGNSSQIFYIGINDNNTAPLAPVVAAELPQGEQIEALAYYGGLICIGTNKGIRLAAISNNGFLTYGPRIDIKDHDGNFVGTTCFDPQGEFIYFGWTDYSSTHTGLGRLSLSEFTSSLVPAYATDLMSAIVTSGTAQAGTTTTIDLANDASNSTDAYNGCIIKITGGTGSGQTSTITDYSYSGGVERATATFSPAPDNTSTYEIYAQGAVQGVVTASNGRRLFSVSHVGWFRDHATNYVASGTIDSGRVRWGTTEQKAVVSADIKHAALAASETVVFKTKSEDDATVTTVVTSQTDGDTTPGISALATPLTGEYVSALIELTGPGGTTPTARRWTLRAIPMPFISEVIKVPIMLSTYIDWDNRHVYHDTYDDYAYLKGLMEARALVSFKIGEEPEQTVYVAGVSYDEGSLTEWTDDRQWFEGILTVQLVTVQT